MTNIGKVTPLLRTTEFSDLAIETLLTVRELYQLPCRMTEGFGKWRFRVMQLELPIPAQKQKC